MTWVFAAEDEPQARGGGVFDRALFESPMPSSGVPREPAAEDRLAPARIGAGNAGTGRHGFAGSLRVVALVTRQADALAAGLRRLEAFLDHCTTLYTVRGGYERVRAYVVAASHIESTVRGLGALRRISGRAADVGRTANLLAAARRTLESVDSPQDSRASLADWRCALTSAALALDEVLSVPVIVSDFATAPRHLRSAAKSLAAAERAFPDDTADD